jgi:hypothetical protein
LVTWFTFVKEIDMRFLLILLAAAAVYLSVYTLGKRGIEPGSQDFWACLVPPCVAGALVILTPKLKKKAKD